MSAGSDIIFVNKLLIHAHHGVMAHEQEVGQRFELDIELAVDLSAASRSDKLADTISYGTIVEVATAAFKGRNFRLVEAAAGAVADAIFANIPTANTVTVTVRKPHAPISAIFADVGVVLRRSREPARRG